MTNLLFEETKISFRQLEKVLEASGYLEKGGNLIAVKTDNQLVILRSTKPLSREQKKFLETEIEDANLTVRLFNVLYSKKIKKMKDILNHPPEEFTNNSRWNEKCSQELNQKLEEVGFAPIF